MKKNLLILLVALSSGVFAQKKLSKLETLIAKTWIFDNGVLGDSIVTLKAMPAKRDTTISYNGYTFSKNKELVLASFVSKRILMCGNGMPFLKEGSWKTTGRTLNIKMKGGYFAAGTYEYDIDYAIVLVNKNKLQLRKIKTIISNRCETCFADLK